MHTEQSIQRKIFTYTRRSNHEIAIPNVRYWGGEQDMISITQAGYLYEYEIKVTYRDFERDFKKHDKHRRLYQAYWNNEYHPRMPNRFYFVVPEDLVTVEDIPEYTGLMWVRENIPVPMKKRAAPELHRNRVPEETYIRFGRNLMCRYWDLRE